MRMKPMLIFVYALLLTIATGPLGLESRRPESLELRIMTPRIVAEVLQVNLDEAVALGIQNSKTLKQKLIAVNAARAALQAAKSSYYPTVSVSATYTHLFEEQKSSEIAVSGFPPIPAMYTGSTDPISLSADLKQTIYTFGKLKKSVEIAEETLKLAELELEEEKRSLIVEIKRAFYWYILAGEVLKVQEQTLEYKKEALRVARKRFDAGLSPDFEVLSAESDVENFRPTVISSANQVRYALLAVKDLLGVAEGEEFDVELIGELVAEYFAFQREELIEKAMEYKYEIGQYENTIAIAELNSRITKSEKKPVIAGFMNYRVQSGFDSATGKPRYWGEDSWDGDLSVGLSVQMPLSAIFPWSRERAEIVQSTLELEQLKLGLESLESGIRLSIENLLLRLEEERAKILSGEKGVELASRLYSSAKERYEKGMASSMELQDSQVSLNAAQLGYLQSVYNYKVAVLDLMDAVGVYQF
jgi:outer membrane protein